MAVVAHPVYQFEWDEEQGATNEITADDMLATLQRGNGMCSKDKARADLLRTGWIENERAPYMPLSEFSIARQRSATTIATTTPDLLRSPSSLRGHVVIQEEEATTPMTASQEFSRENVHGGEQVSNNDEDERVFPFISPALMELLYDSYDNTTHLNDVVSVSDIARHLKQKEREDVIPPSRPCYASQWNPHGFSIPFVCRQAMKEVYFDDGRRALDEYMKSAAIDARDYAHRRRATSREPEEKNEDANDEGDKQNEATAVQEESGHGFVVPPKARAFAYA